MLAFWILVVGLVSVKAEIGDEMAKDDGAPLDEMIMRAGQSTAYGIGPGLDLTETPMSDGTVLQEGDMLLTPEQLAEDVQDKRAEAMGLGKRKGIKSTRYRWDNKVMPYVIKGGTFNSGDMTEINNAIADWNKYTCVTLRERTIEPNYITLQNGKGCSSYVGVINWGSQPVNLARGCRYKRIVLHELGHALGFQHEQCRYDRDDHLDIFINNVEEDMRHNFDKYTRSSMNTHDVPYDYSSVMQYGETAFGGRKMTIQTKDPRYQKLIGTSYGLSFADLKTMNAMYKCGSHCPGSCPSNGYMDKNCQCQCRSNANNFLSGTVPIKNCGSGSGEIIGDGTGGAICDGSKCGCSKGFCWTYCKLGWCYTNGKFEGTQDGDDIPCQSDNHCMQGWSCAGACTPV